MLISKVFKFDSAHKLPYQSGKCSKLHGHTWKLVVTLEGEVKKEGIVIDFKELKEIVNQRVIDKIDHEYLNDIMENPTCENLLLWIEQQLADVSGLKRLRLYESDASFCEIEL